jgi:hypothetical protein
MLPKRSRCILGLENENDEGNAAVVPGRRQRRRHRTDSSNVGALRHLFQEFMGQPDPEQLNTFSVPVCIQLLGVLPEGHRLVDRIHSRVEEFLDAAQEATAPRNRQQARRRPRSPSDSD